MEFLKKIFTKRFILFCVVVFILGVISGVAYGQEAIETASQEEITAEVKPTTPSPTRIVSVKDLAELESAQVALSNAQAVVNHVLNRIIVEYQIDIQLEAVNSRTGEILSIAPVVK